MRFECRLSCVTRLDWRYPFEEFPGYSHDRRFNAGLHCLNVYIRYLVVLCVGNRYVDVIPVMLWLWSKYQDNVWAFRLSVRV